MTDSTLTVFRQSAHPNRLRAYRLTVDGNPIESVRNGGTVTASLTPGTHRIVAQVDWITSAPLQITCSDGAPVFI